MNFCVYKSKNKTTTVTFAIFWCFIWLRPAQVLKWETTDTSVIFLNFPRLRHSWESYKNAITQSEITECYQRFSSYLDPEQIRWAIKLHNSVSFSKVKIYSHMTSFISKGSESFSNFLFSEVELFFVIWISLSQAILFFLHRDFLTNQDFIFQVHIFLSSIPTVV